MDSEHPASCPVVTTKRVADFFRIMDAFFRFSDKCFWIRVAVSRILVLSPCSVKEIWRATLKSVGSRTGVLTISTKKHLLEAIAVLPRSNRNQHCQLQDPVPSIGWTTGVMRAIGRDYDTRLSESPSKHQGTTFKNYSFDPSALIH